jgi:ADP-ribosylglycohydrolase
MTTLPSRLAGGVWGALVGDALGVPYEFRSPESLRPEWIRMVGGGTYSQPAGTWSDDGALTLALLDSMLSVGFDPADQARRYLAWYEEGAYTPDGDGLFDVGGTTRVALERIRAGTPAESAGGTDERANGNGSLMRTLPIALVGRDLDDATLIEQAHRASAVTHAHPQSQVTCAAYVLIAARLLRGATARDALPGAVFGELRARYRASDLAGHLDALDGLERWPTRAGRGYVIDSFWSAWDAFAGAADYQETVVRAIRYGTDTDTTACIAGGLAGVYFGLESIPSEWLAAIRGREAVEPLVERLTATT